MRSSKRKKTAPATEVEQFCVFCATTMPFECIEAADHLVDEPDEWICVQCGFALLVDPPLQQASHTA
ncbi:hypothetical protein ACQPYH_09035 [Kribbella sp. CA-245084]|jgi:hypothetical protein|uniref:hypothetical protein n=1 Tax=Kribbella sp. CA-245084 TaxID=3239940 RepID=UPI003D916012